MKKKAFLLLEILMGLLLIEIAAIPLLKKPVEGYREEIRSLEEAEGERLAEWTFMEIKEKLFTHEIPWEGLPKPGEEKTFFIPNHLMEIPGFAPKELRREFLLRCDKHREKRGTDQGLYRLLKVRIQFDPYLKGKKKKNGQKIPYEYRVIVRKMPL